MAVNADKPLQWKTDITESVDFFNEWFLRFAPATYRESRAEATEQVSTALSRTTNMTKITTAVLRQDPSILPMLRMATAPPIARDRPIGLAGVSTNLVKSMELNNRIPPKMDQTIVDADLEKIGEMIRQLADEDIFPWLGTDRDPVRRDVRRAATIVADRLCGSQADPIIRNAQEQRQLTTIGAWLRNRGYSQQSGISIDSLQNGQFAFRVNVPVHRQGGGQVNIPVDIVVEPQNGGHGELPLLIEAKSAGDFTNTNKRRKEEAQKVRQLRSTYGENVKYVLFLCGYFGSEYLGYEAAEGIDWVWEHRPDDLQQFGL
ncbi:MAG: restriction endonuclease [SAR202 cluster bacterium Io17-Chloro-G9]|nr:MAG: restriction endonuclease [SAR202 cluster bacterium Io17-Chloro-G9]